MYEGGKSSELPHNLVGRGCGPGEWLTVAPGYLEEGLLHSEAGQQNWWAMSSSSSSLRDRQTGKRDEDREVGEQGGVRWRKGRKRDQTEEIGKEKEKQTEKDKEIVEEK